VIAEPDKVTGVEKVPPLSNSDIGSDMELKVRVSAQNGVISSPVNAPSQN
jgi:hypothetical protein